MTVFEAATSTSFDKINRTLLDRLDKTAEELRDAFPVQPKNKHLADPRTA